MDIDLVRLIELLPDPVVVIDSEFILIYVSSEMERLVGWKVEEWVGRNALELIHPDDIPAALAAMEGMTTRNEIGPPLEMRVVTADGAWKYLEVVARNLFGHAGIDGLAMCCREVTNRRWWEVSSDANERFRQVAKNAAAIVVHLDHQGVILDVSGGWTRTLGRYWVEAIGCQLVDFVVAADRPRLSAELDAARRSRHVTKVEARLVHVDGEHTVPHDLAIVNLIDDPVLDGFVVTAHDITDLDEARRALEHLATHDPLTGLANRVLLTGHLREMLRADDQVLRGALAALVDLNGFKSVNDHLGHHAGDQLLVRVAERLSALADDGDMVARLGGDEFVIVTLGTGRPEQADELRIAIERVFERPFTVGSHSLRITASVGVAVAGFGETPDTILARSDRSMYAVKNREIGTS